MSENQQHDIFISYAHIDNESPKRGLEGWVTRFHRALEVRVAQVRGEPARIFRDPKLQGNDVFADVLVSRLRESGVLISVLTPRYVKSEWCSRELKEFCGALEKTGSLVVGGHKSRVFKVLKTNVPQDKTPEEMRSLIGYEFYNLDEKGRPQELDELYGEESEQEFWERLNDLAYDLSELLDLMESDAAQGSPKPAVYLAETSSTLRGERDALRRDLQRHGYEVRPERTLPLVRAELEQFLSTEIARCKVSVHLLDAVYGVTPEATNESLSVIQNRVARELGRAGRLARLIWIKGGAEVEDERQRRFLEEVRTDPGLDEGADVLETPLEELKTVLYERLKAAEKPRAEPKPAAPGGGSVKVYLVCDVLDREAVRPVADYLFSRGCEVTLPLFEGAEAELREDHEDNLKICDAVLVYHGQGSAAWQRKKLREILGSGRATPPEPVGVLLAPPDNEAKRDFRSNEAVVMRMPDGFAPEALREFVERARAARQQEVA